MDQAEFEKQFKELFWKARETERREADLEKADILWNEAFSLAKKAESLKGMKLADAAKVEKTDPSKTKDILKPIIEGSDKLLYGEILFLTGSTEYTLGNYKESLSYFEKSLKITDIDKKGNILTNIGNAYKLLKEPEQAITHYKRAIEIPNYDNKALAWYNMGLTFSNTKNYDQAEDCYNKVLENPEYVDIGAVLNSLGIIANKKKQYNQAIDYFKQAQAIPKYKTKGNPLYNLGNIYRKQKNNTEAIKYYQKAYDFFVDSNNLDRADIIQLKILEINGEKLNKSDSALLQQQEKTKESLEDSNNKSLESELANKISKETKDIYNKYHYKSPIHDNRSLDNRFVVLRETSSSVCLVPGIDGDDHRGGGYFFKWNGFGVVIDPGFDFLRNFHDAGFHIKDINLVLVSHNHPDHNQDLKSLDTLFYEMDKRYEDRKYEYLLLCDKNTSDSIDLDEANYREKIYCDPNNIFSEESRSFDLRENGKRKLPFKIQFFGVKHCQSSIGFSIECFKNFRKTNTPALKIGYTGDCEYETDLKDKLGECDLLVANMSQPDLTELNMDQPEEGNWKQKNWHLGYWGTIGLIKDVQAKWNIVGEFWEGLGDARFEMVDAIRKRTGCNNILPADRGLEIDLPEWKGRCVNCDNLKPLDKMKLIRPKKDFDSLHITCTECIL